MTLRDKIITFIMIFVVILPGGISFIAKMVAYSKVELVEDGMAGFALPFINYIFVALGFVALFTWAFFMGHFRDIEQPSYDMLNREMSFDDCDPELKEKGKFGYGTTTSV
ncbi:MAG: hypothetical protein PVH87_11120 [Desulfobacteraceae bacterium]|jgi:hypothetical protein